MANSFISCYIHYVFSTKNREKFLTKETRERLYPYMGGISKNNNIKLIKVGGISDHLHLLTSLSSTITIAKAIQLIKGNSSKWIHDTFNMNNFAWQVGYGAFSIGVS